MTADESKYNQNVATLICSKKSHSRVSSPWRSAIDQTSYFFNISCLRRIPLRTFLLNSARLEKYRHLLDPPPITTKKQTGWSGIWAF